MNLYLPAGWLDVEGVDRLADQNNISMIFIIGTRQIGKTYGVLKLLLDSGRKFILMRRTLTEIDLLSREDLNPFIPIRPNVEIKKDTKYTSRIVVDDVPAGLAMPLSGVAKVRGFAGTEFTDLVFDEFIPESHVKKIRDEGAAFINAVITISGNRELEGRKPLRCWLLANANNIDNPILAAFNLQEKVDEMSRKGQELSIMPDRGIMIINAVAESIAEKRKHNAIFRAIGTESDVARMALKNEFAYNDREGVKKKDLNQYDIVCGISGSITIWRSKHDGRLYVDAGSRRCNVEFADNRRGYRDFIRTYPDIRKFYIAGKISFSDLITKEKFIKIIDFHN